MAETEFDTDDLEQSILEFIEDWKDGKDMKEGVIGPIQALSRMLVFAHDLEKELRGLSDEQQYQELGQIMIEAQEHVHEHSTTVIRPTGERVH